MSDDEGGEGAVATPSEHSTTQSEIPMWQRIIRSAEIIGMVIAVVGIVFAWWHVKDLEKIEHSMSTRSIGSFPDFVDQVETTVKSSKRSLVIACDFPAYGEYDNKGLGIRHAIEDKLREGQAVQLTFLSPGKRELARLAQFPESEWNATMRDETQRRKMLVYMRSHGYNKPRPPVYSDFGETMRNYDRGLLNQQFHGADNSEVTAEMPLFFWIADDREAVLVAQTPGGHEDSAFLTRDAQLITVLKNIAMDYRHSTVPCSPQVQDQAPSLERAQPPPAKATLSGNRPESH